MADAFPLQWPAGWPRTPASRRSSTAYKVDLQRAAKELYAALAKLGSLPGTIVISTNVRPRSLGQADPQVATATDDPGVAVYWATKAHGERVMACDRWLSVRENVRAIGLAVDGLRAIDRAGASQILERAFSAFGALPSAGPSVPPWWEVFGLKEAALEVVDAPMCEARFRELARKAHPDQGGSIDAMTELNRAATEMRAHFLGER